MKRFLTSVMALLTCIVLTAQNDVDTRIPVNEQSNTNTFVVIIANENYKYEHVVPFALNDGETFKLYCEKALGIPEKNIRYAADATLNDMRMQLQWLQKVMKAYGGEAQAIVYYSGHGMPDDNTHQAYLLPVDGNSTMPNSGISTAALYKDLGAMPSTATLVLLDACFSGARRDGQMLATQSKGVAIKPKEDNVTGNLVVFSAAQGGETAYPFQEKKHGLFTYYILEQLQEKGGYVSLGDLSDQVSRLVGRTSIVENDKSQTPTLVASTNAQDWRKWVLTHKQAKKCENVKRNNPTVSLSNSNVEPAISVQSPPHPIANNPTAPVQTPQGLIFTVEGVKFQMVYIKGGTFDMGATDEQGKAAEDDEKPVHQVNLSDFYIGQTEVTQELWEAVMGSNPSKLYKSPKLPVQNISWNDCKDFINELNALTNQRFRLPSEAEWEFAARGGNNDVVGKHSEGFVKDIKHKPHDVKTEQANELGIYDMSGNVWEWCEDWYGPYSSLEQNNPIGAESGTKRVCRGGGWQDASVNCRVTNRLDYAPTYRHNDLGLRLAL